MAEGSPRATTTAPGAAATGRSLPLDAARGLAVVLMALDHCSFFAHVSVVAETYSDRATPLPPAPWFVLGLLTNPSATLFWFLGGLSISLLAAGRRRREGSLAGAVRWLLVRGFFLLAIDWLVMPAMWVDWHHFQPDFDFGLLSSIGVSLWLAAALLALPGWALAALAGALALAHPALYAACRPAIADLPLAARIWAGYGAEAWPHVVFPVLGWLPLLLAGMAVGRAYDAGAWRRPRDWALAGGALLAVWAASRLTGFGDFTAPTPGAGRLEFLLMSKGPPGLDYLSFNLAVGLFALAGFTSARARLERAPLAWLVTFGQASLFFFVAHLLVFRFVETPLRHLLPHAGAARYGLGLAIGLPLLLPLTRFYRRAKVSRPRSVLRYL